ncbi:MAG: 16S rRNA (cytosine(1402)-N(4))-methyltransferase RsmH [Chloroflexi bacterium]|nr:16S rRNA (cytosine(1402)-N(4))-methyltransferase RsmH [Chloroflexota bacterium]OJV94588.1 MAG: 16S rRNA (cytosine(1402)-N(4))-methyltransferase [Chloroflexi bacterium 54-19]
MAGEGNNAPHYSVLFKETLAGLNLTPQGRYIDGTLGAGGHAYGILKATAPTGRLLGLDADMVALGIATERLKEFGDRVKLVQSNFAQLAEVAREEDFAPVQGVVLDLGVSSMQLDDPNRGFSFQGDGPLDMRFGSVQGKLTAAIIVNAWPEDRLVKLFFELGEEPQARRFARAIVEARKQTRFETTGQLANLLAKMGGRPAGRDKRPIHPATKVFQALRMEVNHELERLAEGLAGAVEVLAPGGRLAVISFHSLEDRVVKHFMQKEASDKIVPEGGPPGLSFPKERRLSIITKKPLEATTTELAENRRSRSAKLRVAEKL